MNVVFLPHVTEHQAFSQPVITKEFSSSLVQTNLEAMHIYHMDCPPIPNFSNHVKLSFCGGLTDGQFEMPS